MNTMPVLPMMLAMACAGACALLDKCRTPASVVCALAMVLGMADAVWTRLLPLPLTAALIAATGLWAAASGWRAAAGALETALRAFRAAASLAMAWLVLGHGADHAHLAAHPAHLAHSTHAVHATHAGHPTALAGDPVQLALLLSALLLAAGIALGAASLRQRAGGRNWSLAQGAAALEPPLMGLSLVLMAV